MPAIKDKVVVVTGSTRGYGYAIAESLLGAGAAVAVTGRTRQAVGRALASLQPKGGVSGFLLDVHNEDQVYKLVEDVLREFGHIDIWVNNAGYSNAAGMMLDMNPQEALEMFMANDLGVLHCTQAIMRIGQNTYRESMNNKRLSSISLVGGIPGFAASVESAAPIFAPVIGGAFGALVRAGVFVYVFIRIYNHPIVFTLNQDSAPVRVFTGD